MNDFIKILKNYLNNEVCEVVMTPELATLAARHEVEAIIYEKTKEKSLERKYLYAFYVYKQREAAMAEIRKKLPESITVKGLHIAQFYQEPFHRTFGDVDIIVGKEHKEESASILQNSGYTPHKGRGETEWHLIKNGLDYELHHELLYDDVVNDDIYKEYFFNWKEYVKDGELDWNIHFLYIFIHFRKHFLNNGVGIRFFLDLAVLIKNPQLDWEWIKRELEKLELLEFAQVVYSLIEVWFEISSPIGSTELESAFVESATKKILENGIFGFYDRSNESAMITNEIIRNNHNLIMTRLLLTIRCAFPSYQSMCQTPYYSFLNHRPYLLPAAWVYRWVTARKKFKYHVKRIYGSNQKIEERRRMMEEWNVCPPKRK